MSGRAGALPDFLIVGAEKAATTWLARCLAEHPSIFIPPEKELFFFSSRFDRGLEWYRGLFRDGSNARRIGEATPVYLSHPDAPARIRATLGEIDLIASLRHPVDRAYSAYWHNLRHGRLSPESDFTASLEADAFEIRSRGAYAHHLDRYLATFPRERLLVLLYDEVRAEPLGVLRRCLAFLGVDPGFRPSTLDARLNEGRADITAATGPVRRVRSVLRTGVLWARHHGLLPRSVERRLVTSADHVARTAASLGRRARTWEPLRPDLRAELFDRFYRSDVERLEELLGLDLSGWRPTSPAAGDATQPGRRGPGNEALVAGRSRST